MIPASPFFFFFFFNDTATTEIYTLSLHDALPILIECVLACFDSVEPNTLTPQKLVRTVPGRLWSWARRSDRGASGVKAAGGLFANTNSFLDLFDAVRRTEMDDEMTGGSRDIELRAARARIVADHWRREVLKENV